MEILKKEEVVDIKVVLNTSYHDGTTTHTRLFTVDPTTKISKVAGAVARTWNLGGDTPFDLIFNPKTERELTVSLAHSCKDYGLRAGSRLDMAVVRRQNIPGPEDTPSWDSTFRPSDIQNMGSTSTRGIFSFAGAKPEASPQQNAQRLWLFRICLCEFGRRRPNSQNLFASGVWHSVVFRRLPEEIHRFFSEFSRGFWSRLWPRCAAKRDQKRQILVSKFWVH
eukprot:gene25454-222_t